MFFKNYFLSIADILEAKFTAYERKNQNPADKGELGELFVQEFLEDSLGDNFKIYRGGKVVNRSGEESKQLDIVLCGKRTIKIFGDKGIYPVETVFGTVSVTATLSEKKLLDCCAEFASIPKRNYKLNIDPYLGEKHSKEMNEMYANLFPFNIVFAYKGEIKDWNDLLVSYMVKNVIDHALLPDFIIVNKVGFIEKEISKNKDGRVKIYFRSYPFNKEDNYGMSYSKALYHLYNLSGEQELLKPDYTEYFNQDL